MPDITLEDINLVLERIEDSITTGFAGLHQDLEKIDRAIRENTDALHFANE